MPIWGKRLVPAASDRCAGRIQSAGYAEIRGNICGVERPMEEGRGRVAGDNGPYHQFAPNGAPGSIESNSFLSEHSSATGHCLNRIMLPHHCLGEPLAPVWPSPKRLSPFSCSSCCWCGAAPRSATGTSRRASDTAAISPPAPEFAWAWASCVCGRPGRWRC